MLDSDGYKKIFIVNIGTANRILTPENTLESIILLIKYVSILEFGMLSKFRFMLLLIFLANLTEDNYDVFTLFENVQPQERRFSFDLFVVSLQWLL